MAYTTAQLFDQAIRLPQIPHVMQEVIKGLRDENVSISELAALVSNDQVISAKILRLANSSYFGLRRDVASIRDAVQLIGLTSFRNLVLASSLAGAFPKIEGFDLSVFWRNSILVANLAHVVGRDLEADRDLLFTAGLMHGIGVLLIYLGFPNSARALGEIYQDHNLAEQRALERQLLETDHFEIGMELARRWHFPESIQKAISQYDSPDSGDLPPQVVHAAVIIAKGIQAGSTLGDMLAELPADIAQRLHLDKAWFEEEGEVFDLLLEESAALI